MRRLYLHIILLCLLIASCRKKEMPGSNDGSDGIIKPFTLSFVNQLDEPANIFIYRNVEDFKYSRSPVVSIRLQEDSIYYLQVTQDMQSFYCDWYTDDFQHTGWVPVKEKMRIVPLKTSGEGIPGPWAKFPFLFAAFIADTNTAVLNKFAHPASSIRQVLINRNDPYTYWHVVDMFDYYHNSVWDTVAQEQKQCELTLTKDLHYTVDIFDGERDTVKGYYYPANAIDLYAGLALFILPNGENLQNWWLKDYPVAEGRYPGFNYVADTVEFNNGKYTYLLVRQK